jgi:5-oxoprolinase (ATP-hydrolysing)
MTNTRLTDPEILEFRYPVILREFSIRRGSGGRGKHQGGDGIIRQFEFRRPLTVSLLTSRRTSRPYGMRGGEPGQAGSNELVRASKSREILPSQTQFEVQTGDQLIIRTPGGGGWGPDTNHR